MFIHTFCVRAGKALASLRKVAFVDRQFDRYNVPTSSYNMLADI